MPINSAHSYVSGGGEEIRTLAGVAPIKKRGRCPFRTVPRGIGESIIIFSSSLRADIATEEGDDADRRPNAGDDADDADGTASCLGVQDGVKEEGDAIAGERADANAAPEVA